MVQSINRAFEIVRCVSASYDGIRLQDLANRCRMKKTTVYSLAETLVSEGMLRKDGNLRYQLGELVTELNKKRSSGPIHIILGVAPGGLIDVSARITAQYLSPRLGQPIVVENRPGANTAIGANAVRQATPDGYTFFYGGPMSASPIVVKNGPVDFVTQLKPVSQMISAPLYLLVSSKVPAETMDELIAYMKQHPGELNYAETAPLATLIMSAIADRIGVKFTTIPYKGSGPALIALIAGEVQMALDTVPNYLQHIKSGKLRALMSTGRTRMPELPGVPAAPEIKGIDFNAASVLSMWAPPGTPDAIIQKIHSEIAFICKDPAFREKFRAATHVDPLGTTPAELLKATETDKTFYSKVAKQSGFEPQ